MDAELDFKRYALVLSGVLVIAALPFVIVHPSGPASAGLSAGFLGIMDYPARLLLILPAGMMTGCLRGDERLMFPLSFLLMYLIGALLEMDFVLFPMVRLFILGAILVFAMALSVAQTRLFLAMIFMGGSIAYHIGGFGMLALPQLASPLYFIIGQLLALVLVLAISFSIGFILFSDAGRYGYAKKKPGDSRRLAA